MARGNAASRIRRKQPYGSRQFLRSFVGHSYMAARYEVERWLAKFFGNRPREVTCLLRRETGRSGVNAAMERWRNSSQQRAKGAVTLNSKKEPK